MRGRHLTLAVVDQHTGEPYTVVEDLSEYDLDNNIFDRETVALAVADMVAVMLPREDEA